MRSTNNGASWTAVAAAAANSWSAIAYKNGVFFVTAFGGTNRVMYSTDDGATWLIDAPTADNAWQSITAAGNIFVAVSSDGTNRVMRKVII